MGEATGGPAGRAVRAGSWLIFRMATLGALALLGACATDARLREAELEQVAALLPGRYDNQEQVEERRVAGGASEVALELNVVRIYAPFVAGHVFYAQEGVVGDPRRILSQRLLAFEIDKDERIVQRTLGLADPARWRNGHVNPNLFKALMYQDVQPGAGCVLEWRIESDGFSARALPGACRGSADSRITQAEFTVGEPPLKLRRR
jgi:hypothetical protein